MEVANKTVVVGDMSLKAIDRNMIQYESQFIVYDQYGFPSKVSGFVAMNTSLLMALECTGSDI